MSAKARCSSTISRLFPVALFCATVLGVMSAAPAWPATAPPAPAPAAPASVAPAVPAAPADLKAYPGILQVELQWQPVKGATTYNVYMGTAARGESPTPVLTVSEPKATVRRLTNGTAFFFVVDATVANVSGPKSTEASATPNQDAPPVNVTVTAGDGQITINWIDVGATSYTVYEGVSPGKEDSNKPVKAGVTGTTVTATGLTNEKTYFFTVKAVSVDGAGGTSDEVFAPPSIVTKPDKIGVGLPDTPQGVAQLKALARANCAQLEVPDQLGGETKAGVLQKVQLYIDHDPKAGVAERMKCNAWLAEYMVERQTTSSSASIQAFPKFNASVANNSQLATVHLVKAFLPTWLFGEGDFENDNGTPKTDEKDLHPYVNARFYNDIGIDLSTSVPISGATLGDYGRQELLTRNGGLVNAYFSFSGRNYSNEAYSWGDRAANLDHLYWIDVFGPREPATAKEALGYFSEGIGVKALKTSLTGTNSLAAQGTAYFGVGLDGPLFFAAENTTDVAEKISNNPAGMVSLEVYACENYVNGQTLTTLLGTKDPPHTYPALGVNLSLNITSSIAIQLQYTDAVGSGRNSVGHVAMFTIGYNKAPAAQSQSPTPATGQAAPKS